MKEVEGLIHRIEDLPDPAARNTALELAQVLMDFHGASLERLMEIVANAGESDEAVFDNFAADELVGNLLLLHGLHPVPLELRVTKALDKVRPALDSHGGSVVLLGISEGVVRLRLQGSCKACPSSAMTLQRTIEEAIYAGAPDVVAIETEGAEVQQSAAGLVQIGKSGGAGNPAGSVHGLHPHQKLVHQPHIGERCELCGAELALRHEHLAQIAKRQMVCACQACAILLSGKTAAKYRRVPQRVVSLSDFQLTDAQWERLPIPIGMVFFFRNSIAGKMVALYPSAAGATESLLDSECWNEIIESNPILQDMEPDTEALLINRVRGASEYYLLPIDECYKLVGLIRTKWQGLSGGTEVWEAIGKFFAELKEKSGGPGKREVQPSANVNVCPNPSPESGIGL